MADKINVQKTFSGVNEALTKLFDESGVKRTFTIPYIDGQGADEHINAVGQKANEVGGLTNNLITTMHHSGGKGWGTGDGHTVGYLADHLRDTEIPTNDEHAKAAIDAAQKHINEIAKGIGDDAPEIKVANGQLALLKKHDAAGMNLMDFGVMIQQMMHAPNQAIARAHSGTKEGGHAPHLRPPGKVSQDEQEGDSGAQGGGQGAPAAGEAAPAAQAAPAAPAAAGAPPAAPVAAAPAAAAPSVPAQA